MAAYWDPLNNWWSGTINVGLTTIAQEPGCGKEVDTQIYSIIESFICTKSSKSDKPMSRLSLNVHIGSVKVSCVSGMLEKLTVNQQKPQLRSVCGEEIEKARVACQLQ